MRADRLGCAARLVARCRQPHLSRHARRCHPVGWNGVDGRRGRHANPVDRCDARCSKRGMLQRLWHPSARDLATAGGKVARAGVHPVLVRGRGRRAHPRRGRPYSGGATRRSMTAVTDRSESPATEAMGGTGSGGAAAGRAIRSALNSVGAARGSVPGAGSTLASSMPAIFYPAEPATARAWAIAAPVASATISRRAASTSFSWGEEPNCSRAVAPLSRQPASTRAAGPAPCGTTR